MIDHIQKGYLALLNSITHNTPAEVSFEQIKSNYNIISSEYFLFNSKTQ